jgi:hypothetical protein
LADKSAAIFDGRMVVNQAKASTAGIKVFTVGQG